MIQSYMQKLLETFITMASEKDEDVLLENILNGALDLTNCDAGTLYILNNDKLEFRTMMTRSMNIKKGGKNEKITLPPVELLHSNVCAYAVLENRTINIPDVYRSELFDFSGPKNYDKLTNYRTKSMLVIPMENDKGKIIGVMQLLNAKDDLGNIISFSAENEMVLTAIASQSAIKLTNLNYMQEMKELMESIVRTFAEVIYLRTPYNVSHTHNMEFYAQNFMHWLQEHPEKGLHFDEETKRLFFMSIWLHDIGKLITPLEVMDKSTRLSSKLERVMTRLDIIALTTKVNCLIQGTDFTEQLEEIEKTREFVLHVNTLPFLDDTTLAQVYSLKEKTYLDEEQAEKLWFTPDEIEDLSIIRGTLTPNERKIIQRHVVMTAQILKKMNFKYEFTKVPKWASSHHEFLDGSGYPNKLTAKDLDLETRLLTIIDVFDGLSASDRPYKKPTPIDKVFIIMEEMVFENKLDGQLLSLFKESKAWELAPNLQ